MELNKCSCTEKRMIELYVLFLKGCTPAFREFVFNGYNPSIISLYKFKGKWWLIFPKKEGNQVTSGRSFSSMKDALAALSRHIGLTPKHGDLIEFYFSQAVGSWGIFLQH